MIKRGTQRHRETKKDTERNKEIETTCACE